jgi:hypothetical protein
MQYAINNIGKVRGEFENPITGKKEKRYYDLTNAFEKDALNKYVDSLDIGLD